MDWDNELVLQLIDEYEKFPILWDAKHNEHFCRNKKNDAWETIALNLDVKVFEVKQKINSLLGSFRRERARGKKSVRIGKGNNGIYISKWFAFDKMSFLLNKDETQPTIHTKLENSNETYLQQLYTKPEDENHNDNVPEKQSSQILSPGPPKKKIQKVTRDPMLGGTYEVTTAPLKPSMDALSTYGQYVVNKLRTYTKTTQIEVEHAINSILYNADKGLYDRIVTQPPVKSFPTNFNVISPPSPSTSTSTPTPLNSDMLD